jgi:hypothetical protein
MPKSIGFAFVALALAASSTSALAQSEENIAGALALQLTPAGGLSPIVSRAMIGGPAPHGPQFAARYGHSGLSFDGGTDGLNVDNYAVTGLFPAGQAGTVYLTLGANKLDCDACKTRVMFSGGGDVALGSQALGSAPNGARLTFSLDGELGYTNQEGGYALSGAVGVPVSVVFTSGNMRVAPFLTPGYGYGRTHASDATTNQDQSAGRVMLGGGLAVLDVTSVVGVTLGFQKVFLSEGDGIARITSKTSFGIGVTFGR